MWGAWRGQWGHLARVSVCGSAPEQAPSPHLPSSALRCRLMRRRTETDRCAVAAHGPLSDTRLLPPSSGR